MINVTLPPKRLRDYERLVNKKVITDIKTAASRLRGLKIVEINSTAEGGGVAELLKSFIPLAQDAGIDISWRVLMPDTRFFKITKTIHNCLQGICPLPPTEDLQYYREYLAKQARYLPEADLYILHDPQTLGLIDALPNKPIIWRCHIDLTSSDETTLEWVKSYYAKMQKIIFSLDNYALGVDKSKVELVTPSIDPLSEKNKPMPAKMSDQLLADFNISSEAPFIAQISRFDKFKDPIGVLEIFAKLKQEIPDLGCVLMGGYATDDPEGYPYFQQVRAKITDLKLADIRVITKEDSELVNAIQSRAALILQNSSREGFGLTVTEALYKGALVFAKPVGGIALQVINNRTGFYLLDPARDKTKMLEAIRSPEKFAQVRKNATRHVAANFLITSMLARQLKIYTDVLRKS